MDTLAVGGVLGRSVLITCEHGGNRVPAMYQHLFQGWETLLDTHRGYDPGALELATRMARHLGTPLLSATTSRLLIDLNRSPGHPRLYSEVTRHAPFALRSQFFEEQYLPYRRRVEDWATTTVARGCRAIHISCHSFTPQLNGQTRNTDLGLLYDPSRRAEHMLCKQWQIAMKRGHAHFTTRRNYPYRGKSDSLAAYLRRRLPDPWYVGIELEINQKHVLGDQSRWPALQAAVIETLDATLSHAKINPKGQLARG
jgi:predicted N-formylglutamate amidohydrolase